MSDDTYKVDNNKLKKLGKVALDIVDKAYLGTTHGKYYFAHIHNMRSHGIGYNFVEADSVADGVDNAVRFLKKHKLKALRLRFVGHGTVGEIFLGANIEELPGKFIKFEKDRLINGEPLPLLLNEMAKDGRVELRGCSVMKGYQEPSLLEKAGKKIGEMLDLKQAPPHPGAGLLLEMARLIGKPVRAADDVNNAAGFDLWGGLVYEATPGGSIQPLPHVYY